MASRLQERTGVKHIRRKQRTARGREKSANRTQASRQKGRQREREARDEILQIPAPDAAWPRIPFADADVSAAKLPAAKNLAVHAMQEWGVKVEASRASGLGRDRLNAHMKADPVFRRRMLVAQRNCIERIEREMIRRGMLARGELAAIYVTKHNIPKYREIQRVELTGKGGAPVAYVDAKAELLRRLEQLVMRQKLAEQPDAAVVGAGPKLLRGGSSNGIEVGTIRKTKAEGFGAKSRK